MYKYKYKYQYTYKYKNRYKYDMIRTKCLAEHTRRPSQQIALQGIRQERAQSHPEAMQSHELTHNHTIMCQNCAKMAARCAYMHLMYVHMPMQRV